MQYSTNYSFKLPELTDPVNIADLDYNFSLIDSDLADWISPVCASLIAANIDTTLSVQGKAADAAAVGTAITGVMNALNTGLTNLIDNTLSVSGKAADAKVTGDKLKYFGAHPTVTKKLFDLWAYGLVNGSTGAVGTSGTTRRRTVQFVGVEQGIFGAAVGTTLSQQFYVYAYQQDDTYVGVWKDNAFAQASSGYTAVTSFDFTQYTSYKFRLMLANTDGSHIPYGDEYIDVWFNVSTVQSNNYDLTVAEKRLTDVTDISTHGTPTSYAITSAGAGGRMNVLNAIFSLTTNSTQFGTLSTSSTSKVYYLQAASDSVVWVDCDFNTHALRISAEEPSIGTSTVWTGRISATNPTKDAPWVVKAGNYIAFSSQQSWVSSMHATINILPLAYTIKPTEPLTDAMTLQIQNMITADYSTLENMSRVSDVYAVLDEIEYYAGNRMSHTDISDVIDDSTKIRAYVIDTSPKRMNWEFEIEDYPFFPKPKVLIIATQHGNERGNVLNIIELCKNLLSNPAYSDIAAQFEWHIIPVVNIWGYNHTMVDGQGNVIWYASSSNYTIVENTSTLKGGVYNNAADGMSINSDFADVGGFTTAEARAVRDYFISFDHFIACFDLHQWWSANQPNVIGFASMVADHAEYKDQYYRCWCSMAAGAKEAEDYIRARVSNPRTHFQMVFGYGNYQSQVSSTSHSARSYFAGVGGNTLHTDKAVPFTATMESNMNLNFLTGTTTPYTELERIAANVFAHRMIVAVCKAALTEFAKYPEV